MAVLTSTGITFSDSTSQTTAATAAALVTTANVLSATAGASFGDVGTYAALINTTTTNTASGSTLAGGSLQHSTNFGFTGGGLGFQSNGSFGGTTVSGTWRRMGGGAVFRSACCNTFASGLWLRIS